MRTPAVPPRLTGLGPPSRRTLPRPALSRELPSRLPLAVPDSSRPQRVHCACLLPPGSQLPGLSVGASAGFTSASSVFSNAIRLLGGSVRQSPTSVPLGEMNSLHDDMELRQLDRDCVWATSIAARRIAALPPTARASAGGGLRRGRGRRTSTSGSACVGPRIGMGDRLWLYAPNGMQTKCAAHEVIRHFHQSMHIVCSGFQAVASPSAGASSAPCGCVGMAASPKGSSVMPSR